MAQSVRAHLRYSIDHEWLEDGEPARVGITTVAADALGEVVFVELPEVGAQVEAGEPYGAGWLFTVTVSAEGDLLSAQDYADKFDAVVDG